jgi:hypothetical protein
MKKYISWVWYYKPRQENSEFQSSLSYIVKPYLKKPNTFKDRMIV